MKLNKKQVEQKISVKKSAATAQYEWVELKTILKPFAEQLH